MGSLLIRMQDVRKRLGLPAGYSVSGLDSAEADASAAISEDGISGDELAEITRKIESVASANRIQVTPQLFSISAKKRGVFLPLMVNLFSLIVLAGGVALMLVFFQQQETAEVQQVVALNSAEGRLLEVLKQEAEANLSAKEQEILAIQEQMLQVQRERDDIAADIEERIANREAQLRASLEQELEQERQRLRAQGLSEVDIEARIREIEQQKTAELNQRLAAFKAEAEAEKTALEESLGQMEQEFSQSLAEANRARDALQAEARQREADLRAELEKAQSQNQAELDQASQDVQQAKNELAALAEARETERRLSAQLTGFYSQVRGQLNAGNTEGARETVKQLRAFLNSPQVLETESLSQRRDVELFLASSMENLIDGNVRNQQETTSLREAASALGRIQQLYSQARQYEQQGESDLALQTYQKTVEVLPEVAAASRSVGQARVSAVQTEYEAQLEEIQTGLVEQLQEELDEREARITELEDQILLLQTEMEQYSKANQAEYEQRIAELQEQLTAMQQSSQAATERAELLATENQQLSGENQQLQERVALFEEASRSNSNDRQRAIVLEEQLAEARVVVNKYESMLENYASYRQRSALAVGNVLQGKAALDWFLGTESVQEAFPGLLEQVKRFDRAFEEAGQETVVYEMADEIYRIYSYSAQPARVNYVRSAMRGESRQAMKEFYENMLLILEE